MHIIMHMYICSSTSMCVQRRVCARTHVWECVWRGGGGGGESVVFVAVVVVVEHSYFKMSQEKYIGCLSFLTEFPSLLASVKSSGVNIDPCVCVILRVFLCL